VANPFARLFAGNKTGKIEDFSAFIAALAQRWNPACSFVESEAGDGGPRPESEARLLFLDSDRPTAVVLAPPGSSPALDALTSYVRASLALLAPNQGAPHIVAASGASIVPEYRDYLLFASIPDGWILLFDDPVEEGFASLLESLGPKELAAAAAAAFSPEALAAPVSPVQAARSVITDPWSACAARLLFPAAVQAGETAIRFTPRSFAVGSAGEGTASETWYRFGVKTEFGSLGGFWAFGRPDSIPVERFPSLAASLAKAAGAALATEYSAFHLGGTVSSAAAPTEAPKLGAAAVFTLEGSVAVGTAHLDLRVVVPQAYPLKLASVCGQTEKDAISAILATDRVLALRLGEAAIDSRAQMYRYDASSGSRDAETIRFVPFYELLGLLSEADYRRLAQNFMIRRYHREEIAELFFYRKTIMVDGAPKRVLVRPQAFDLSRFITVLPEAVQEAFVAAVHEGASSATADDFILRNESLYEGAMADIRRDALELGYRARQLIGLIYTRYVYPRKRKRLDAMIEKDFPFAQLRTLPPRQFRSVVDGSDFGTIAAALVGHEEAIAEIGRWCSGRKLKNIREELERTVKALAQGAADADRLCTLRSNMAKKAEEVRERERQEGLAEAIPVKKARNR
jgi:hypothetical protein